MNELVNSLRQCDVFHQFTQTQLEMVANLCQEKNIPAGQIIFEENSNSKELYVILQGEVEILIDPGTFTYISDPAERNRFRSTRSGYTYRRYGVDRHQQRGEARSDDPGSDERRDDHRIRCRQAAVARPVARCLCRHRRRQDAGGV